MLVIPVIDIKDGKCVRIFQGHGEKTEYYTHTPLNAAKLFRKENFKTIHITDLDGALFGEMRNYEMIKEIAQSIDVPIELGGGIRTYETAEKVIRELGVYRIVIGTAAISNSEMIKNLIKDFGSSKIVVGIDEKLNNVVTHGWIDYVNITPMEFAKKMEDIGINRIIYQDVTRVGNLCGPHINRLVEIADNTRLRITSAGGICSYEDFKTLKALNRPQIDSVLVSRALYENQFPCQKMWRDLEREDTSLELPKVK